MTTPLPPTKDARFYFREANAVVEAALAKYPALKNHSYSPCCEEWAELETILERAEAECDHETVKVVGEELIQKQRRHLWQQIRQLGLAGG